MSIALSILLFAGVTNISLGLLVYARNPKSYLSRSFTFVVASIVAWSVSNFATDHALVLSQNVLFNRLAYVFGALSVVSMTAFSYAMRRKRLTGGAQFELAGLGAVLLSVFSASELVAGTVTRQADGLVFMVGQYILVWIVIIFILLSLIARNFWLMNRSDSARDRNQARVISIGMLMTVVLAMTTNVIWPAMTADSGASTFDHAKFGPLLTIFVVAAIAYSIIKHGLFDIERVIYRSIVYMMTILAIATLYYAVFFIMIIPMADVHVNAYSILVSAVLAMAFQPIRRLFDKFSSRLLYKKGYDLKDALSSIGHALTLNVELDKVLNTSAQMICDTLQVSYTQVAIMEDGKMSDKSVAGRRSRRLSGKQIEYLYDVSEEDLLVTDWESEKCIHQRLSDKKIGAFMKLKLQGDYDAVIILGRKQDGGMYSSTDISFLDISAKNIVVTLENALKYEQIQRFSATLESKIGLATRELRRLNLDLKKLDSTKGEFISMASHQLRPQLAASEGFLDLLEESSAKKLSKYERENIQFAKASIQKMIHIVVYILEAASNDKPSIKLDKSNVDMVRLAKDEVRYMQRYVNDRKILVISDEPRINVDIDEAKIREAIYNLLQNAIDYGHDNTDVTLSIVAREDSVEVSVADLGPGMDDKVAKKVFGKFFRSSRAKSSRPDGTGMGLYVVKTFVEAHKGSVGVKSSLDKGSTFSFTLPVA